MDELIREIRKRKQDRNALILAHNYQRDEVQAVADHVGDSFYLSKIAAQAECDTIVFAGVRFMAETAKILSPAKTVLLPEPDAGCPLADTVAAADVAALKRLHPGAPVVCYINSSAAVKALSDICCTSANTVKVVASLPDAKVIFVPDANLGAYVAGRLPGKELVLWKGACATHAKITPRDILAAREKHPAAKILVHPECAPAVVKMADFAGSTADIIRYAAASPAPVLLIGTEAGVLSAIKASRPDRQVLLLHPGLVCPDMKKTRLESVRDALLHDRHQVSVDAAVADKARQAITRMLGVV
ncbi:quinolinate synthase NadA [Anaeroselena agilis]|uniref:Quinolinate synthase n=1 Tax=Anaeroselena agilis TaxID=3063788 RepID=A0ABU3P043_9FIRM|nr:quinolinate synthase NadA [Selenomonadales bacterium 4137-cl]